MNFINGPAFTATRNTTVPLTATVNGLVFPSLRYSRASATAQVTGSSSLVATLKMQFSDDVPPDEHLIQNFVPTNWNDVPNASLAITADGAYALPESEVAYRFLRPVMSVASGSATALGGSFAANGVNS